MLFPLGIPRLVHFYDPYCQWASLWCQSMGLWTHSMILWDINSVHAVAALHYPDTNCWSVFWRDLEMSFGYLWIRLIRAPGLSSASLCFLGPGPGPDLAWDPPNKTQGEEICTHQALQIPEGWVRFISFDTPRSEKLCCCLVWPVHSVLDFRNKRCHMYHMFLNKKHPENSTKICSKTTWFALASACWVSDIGEPLPRWASRCCQSGKGMKKSLQKSWILAGGSVHTMMKIRCMTMSSIIQIYPIILLHEPDRNCTSNENDMCISNKGSLM